MKLKHVIDPHKASNAAVILGMMWFYRAWDNPTAWVYLALHGTYGLLWLLKSLHFGDKQWERSTPLWFALVAGGALSLYWVGPWIITAHDVRAPAWYLGTCVAVWGLGVFLHFASDMQKHVQLSLRPGELFSDGLWSRTRNPNYLGELLIYASFCALPMHWAPPLVLAAFVAVYWLPHMIKKDRSLSRYPGFAEWRARSGLLFPRLFRG